jgi:hypothetical protein
MIGGLTIGRRYRIGLQGRALAGFVEGVLRSVRVPGGFMGNDDGAHSVWVAGETFEWFLRPEEIASIRELEVEPEPAPQPAIASARGELCEVPRYSSGLSSRRSSRPFALDAVSVLPHEQSRRKTKLD